MPLYEFQCDTCASRFERIQKYADPPTAVCPSCGAEAHKILSPPAIQFKGSGWYVTDYARKGSSAGSAEKADKDKTGKTDASDKPEKSPKSESSGSAEAAAPATTKSDS
jgi:putative FmdB family regulatory protein